MLVREAVVTLLATYQCWLSGFVLAYKNIQNPYKVLRNNQRPNNDKARVPLLALPRHWRG
jgi:hypothetical protein